MTSPATPPTAHASPILLHALAKNWWLFLIRGICGIIFGFLAFTLPGITLVTLVLLYGAYAFADGVFSLIAAVKDGGSQSRWWLAIVGLCGIAAGITTFAFPGLAGLVLLFLIAGWAIAIGVFEIIGAIELRKQIDNEWMLILSGIVSILFGFVLLLRPGAGAIALVWMIGSFSILFGFLNVGFALRLRSHNHDVPVGGPMSPAPH